MKFNTYLETKYHISINKFISKNDINTVLKALPNAEGKSFKKPVFMCPSKLDLRAKIRTAKFLDENDKERWRKHIWTLF